MESAAGSLGVKSLDAYDTGMVALMWLPLLAAAYATLVLQAIPKGAGVLAVAHDLGW